MSPNEGYTRSGRSMPYGSPRSPIRSKAVDIEVPMSLEDAEERRKELGLTSLVVQQFPRQTTGRRRRGARTRYDPQAGSTRLPPTVTTEAAPVAPRRRTYGPPGQLESVQARGRARRQAPRVRRWLKTHPPEKTLDLEAYKAWQASVTAKQQTMIKEGRDPGPMSSPPAYLYREPGAKERLIGLTQAAEQYPEMLPRGVGPGQTRATAPMQAPEPMPGTPIEGPVPTTQPMATTQPAEGQLNYRQSLAAAQQIISNPDATTQELADANLILISLSNTEYQGPALALLGMLADRRKEARGEARYQTRTADQREYQERTVAGTPEAKLAKMQFAGLLSGRLPSIPSVEQIGKAKRISDPVKKAYALLKVVNPIFKTMRAFAQKSGQPDIAPQSMLYKDENKLTATQLPIYLITMLGDELGSEAMNSITAASNVQEGENGFIKVLNKWLESKFSQAAFK